MLRPMLLTLSYFKMLKIQIENTDAAMRCLSLFASIYYFIPLCVGIPKKEQTVQTQGRCLFLSCKGT